MQPSDIEPKPGEEAQDEQLSPAGLVAAFITEVSVDELASVLGRYVPAVFDWNRYSTHGQGVFAVVLSNPGVEFGTDDFGSIYPTYTRTQVRQSVRALYRGASGDKGLRELLKTNELDGRHWRIWSIGPGGSPLPPKGDITTPVSSAPVEIGRVALATWGLSLAEYSDGNATVLIGEDVFSEDPLEFVGLVSLATHIDGLSLDSWVKILEGVADDPTRVVGSKILRAIRWNLGKHREMLVDSGGRPGNLRLLGALSLESPELERVLVFIGIEVGE